MGRIKFLILAALVVISFFLNVLGLMGLIPIYITSPILFISLFLFIFTLTNHKRFRGFKSKG